MLVLEYDGQLLVIDCGLMFPEHDMLGIDIVIPDISYVVERAENLLGVLVTHGHEDHHGALPYLLHSVDGPVPIYGGQLTRGLIEVKLGEHGVLNKAELHVVEPGDRLETGPFEAEFFHVCHSIPDSMGIAVDTPVGLVVFSGEYKFDYTPTQGRLTDAQRLADYGGHGVLALFSDSTNVERPGYTPSEQVIAEEFDKIFSQAKGRIIVATFASNISRVQQVITVARKYKRRVGLVGRSMVNNGHMAINLGYLDIGRDELLRPEEIEALPPRKVAIVCTGTQGEPTSALVRMANQEHRWVTVREGDTVILSASAIPGNEELIHRTINSLFRLGARVYYPPMQPVHVSGHASQEEQKLLLTLTQPKFFVPVGGEYRHLALHGQLAEQVGVSPENIFVLESGEVIEFTSNSARVTESVGGRYVYVDGLGVGDIGSIVLRDRHHLASDGFFIVVVALNRESGELLDDVYVISRGFVYMRESEDLLEKAKQQVVGALRRHGSHPARLDDTIKAVLSQFLYEQTKRRPMILPVVMEI
jgi:ribonuclease J